MKKQLLAQRDGSLPHERFTTFFVRDRETAYQRSHTGKIPTPRFYLS